MKLGSAFQKVNFLRDFKSDIELLERSYFPNVNLQELDFKSKQDIIDEIKADFQMAYEGIIQLPTSSKRGWVPQTTIRGRVIDAVKVAF